MNLLKRIQRLEARRKVTVRAPGEGWMCDLREWVRTGTLRLLDVRRGEDREAAAYLANWKRAIKARLKAIADLEE